jgi:hypothetical protein
MRKMRESFALVLIMLVASSSLILLTVKPAFAQTPTPFPATFSSTLAIPQFTIQLADHSYDVPSTTTTTTDPYTGKQIVTNQSGYHVENKTIDFTVVNQPHLSVFVPHYYGVNLYYDIRVKGHFSTDWSELFGYDGNVNYLPIAPNKTYTEISIPQNYPSDAQVDFQMRSINGTIRALNPGINSPFAYWKYEASGWSSIYTLNITDGSVITTPFINPTPAPTSTPNPLPTSTQTPTATSSPTISTISPTTSNPPQEQNTIPFTTFLIVTVIFAVILVILLVLLFRRHKANCPT